ncbi:MAG: hypothetical protein C0428_06770 [Polaromonas sp.]|nr:hypothetical protein [Polaromonas sp.]
MDKPVPDKIDVALSGGGIRSATFALGVLQTLAQHELLHRIRTLSTVSGGGYIGSFLCRLAAQVQLLSGGAPAGEAWKRTGQVLLTPTSQPVQLAPSGAQVFHPLQWLRENSRYLTPSGSDDLVSGLAYYLRGLLGLHFNLAVLLLLLGLVNVTLGAVGDAGWQQWVAQGQSVRGWLAQPAAAPAGQCLVAPAPVAPSCPWWVPSGWWLVVGVLLGLAVAVGVAYWLTARRTRSSDDSSPVSWQEKIEARMGWAAGLALLATFGIWAVLSRAAAPQHFRVAAGLAMVCVLAGLINLAALLRTRSKPAGTQAQALEQADRRSELERAQLRTDIQRRRLTRWLSWTLTGAAAVAVIALIDTLAMSLVQYRASYGSWLPWSLPVAVYGSVLAAAWKWLNQAEPVDGRPPRFAGLAQAALLLLALAVLAGLALMYQMLAYEIVLGGKPLAVAALRAPLEIVWPQLLVFMPGLLLVAVCVQYTPGFLNLSSFHNLYTARLKRAYLGAANPKRLLAMQQTDAAGDRERRKAFVSEVMAGDEPASITAYLQANQALGIEHVVNITLNQRISATSPTLAQDRQGVPVSLTAQGMLVDAPQGSAVRPRFDLVQMQESPLSLGQWMSISGAAFSVGVGKETRPGYALLAFLANVRTAYWWRRPPAGQGQDTPHREGTWNYLLEEARCRFLGQPGRYWYLSDGGHFDNTGVYELVRRKLPLVLASDNGADPCYQFDDLMHLVRRVRIDFGAEAVFRSAAEIGGLSGFGTPEAFRKAQKAGEAMPYAVWLELYYDREHGRPRDTATEPPDTVVIFIKPALPEGLPGDVGHYARTHPSFPQETTADQFFDEAQWESYRALGQTLSARLLAQDVFGAVASRLAPRQGRLL